LYSLNIDAIPLVIEPFFKDEKFLIGIGKSMRLYEIGKKKLLLKAEVRNLSSAINQIRTIGKKIYVTFISDSFHLFKYIPEEKTFYDIAEDQLPKFITAMNILDSETVCAGDKFGNIFVGRLT
jgi:splicing factor 3B subunit 3